MDQKPVALSPADDQGKPDRQERVKRVLGEMADGIGLITDILRVEAGEKRPGRLS